MGVFFVVLFNTFASITEGFSVACFFSLAFKGEWDCVCGKI